MPQHPRRLGDPCYGVMGLDTALWPHLPWAKLQRPPSERHVAYDQLLRGSCVRLRCSAHLGPPLGAARGIHAGVPLIPAPDPRQRRAPDPHAVPVVHGNGTDHREGCRCVDTVAAERFDEHFTRAAK